MDRFNLSLILLRDTHPTFFGMPFFSIFANALLLLMGCSAYRLQALMGMEKLRCNPHPLSISSSYKKMAQGYSIFRPYNSNFLQHRIILVALLRLSTLLTLTFLSLY